MSSLNAMGHVLVAEAVDGPNRFDELWALLDEMAAKITGEPRTCIVVHSTGFPGQRYCVHPTGDPAQEIRSDALKDALLKAALWSAQQLGDELWARA